MGEVDNAGRCIVGRRALLRAAGGAVALSAAGSAAAQQGGAGGEAGPDWGDWFTESTTGGVPDNYDGTTADLRGQEQVTVGVGAEGNGGPFAFDPPAIWIDPGATVTFEWVSDNHNVIPQSQPEGAGWAGQEAIENTGFSYEHTFETGGIYTYYCQPHLPLGMKAAVAVGDDVPTASVGPPAGDGGPSTGRDFPGGDVGLTFMAAMIGSVGIAAVAVLGAELYGAVGRGASTVGEETESPEGVVREIGHDEFDPVGTATLIVLYFLILIVMWVFVYFVEFLGRGPTVVG